jgi:hypothetical protein
MQKWEYKAVLRKRGWKAQGSGEYWHRAGEWDVPVEEILKLGEQGWE